MIQPTHKTEDSPIVEMYLGDCAKILSQLDRKFQLIFADPPFNIRQNYDTCKDAWTEHEYRQFTTNWLDATIYSLDDNGALWVNVPDEIVAFVDETVFQTHSLTRINWIVWHFKFGQCNKSRFIRSKTHLLYYARDPKNRIWNPNEIAIFSDRAIKYGDKRTMESQTPGKRVPLDVWSVDNDGSFFGRVQGNSAERCAGHPNQLPEKVLERIVRACTNSGDWVLDPFAGSGTTTCVARALDRNSVGIDISPAYCKAGFERTIRGAVRISKKP